VSTNCLVLLHASISVQILTFNASFFSATGTAASFVALITKEKHVRTTTLGELSSSRIRNPLASTT